MEELKPCPFCGRPGRIVQCSIFVDEKNYASYFAEEYRAECSHCGANTGTRHQSRFVRRNGEIFFEKDGYAAAVESWNRRAETGGIALDPEKAEGG